MPSLVASASSGFEPIPGYVLRHKLGAGGYGEVWLADAPGGLKKAIKFVFGSIDDERAAGELRSLQRIRQVNHPFILSLERIEVVDGQLMIVTELADGGSLFDRFKEYRDSGLVGIPRDRLLEYLRDSADALDFLCHKHDLQHLDVKPANLLLVADRVKVADFGLIKDVQRQSMSMLSGLTPTYAAPEMFDGRPGRFSDQYSLAILYQELLTGTLPFRGRTTAQLASEHLHKAPNLDAVPSTDRPVLAKCLAKKPTQRFSNCREFVDHLIQSDARLPSIRTDAAASQGDVSQGENPRTSDLDYARPQTLAIEKRKVAVFSDDGEIEGQPASHAKCLFFGIGATGTEILTNLRFQLQQANFDLDQQLEWNWLAVDTDADSLDMAVQENSCGHLSAGQTLYLPLQTAQHYRTVGDDRFSPVSRRWLYNIPRSKRTDGVRPLSMLALLDHASACYRELTETLRRIRDRFPDVGADRNERLRIYLAASAHGATGSGMMVEFAFMLQQIASLEEIAIDVQAIMTVGNQSQMDGKDLASANALSCFAEMSHYHASDGLHTVLPGLPDFVGTTRPPIDNVYLVEGGQIGRQDQWERAIESAADYLLTDGCTLLGKSLDRARSKTFESYSADPDAEWSAWFRTVASRRLVVTQRLTPESLASLSAMHISQRWLMRLRIDGEDMPENLAESNRTQIQRRKQLEQIDFLVSDLFREHHWTAQAWLKRCLEMLSVGEQPIDEMTGDDQGPASANGTSKETNSNRGAAADRDSLVADSLLTGPPPADDYSDADARAAVDAQVMADLDSHVDSELDALTQRLGLNLSDCRLRARDQIQEAIDQFSAWLQKTWLRSRSSWGYLSKMLGLVSNRFVQQGNSLQAVSQRFRTEHDALLDKIHTAGESSSSATYDQQQLHALEMQARTHDLAGRMLIRVGEHVEQLEELWRVEASRMCDELVDWILPLAEQLDLRLNPNGTLRDAPTKMPEVWEPIRQTAQIALEEYYEAIAIHRLYEAWGWSLDPEIHRDHSTKSTDGLRSQPGVDSRVQPSRDGVESSQSISTCSSVASTTSSAVAPRQQSEAIQIRNDGDLALGMHGNEACTRFVRIATAAIYGTMDETGFDPESEEAREELFLSASAFAERLRESSPKLLAWGGGKRVFLLLPAQSDKQLHDEHWRKQIGEPITILRSPMVTSPTIVSEGERMILSDIVRELWFPCHEKLRLADRLHIRCDVDWIPSEFS
jgi:serine/threonine protein kinase